jgi:hypothetical protein
MKYIKYFLFFIPHLLVTWLCWLTNPIACLFPVRQANGRDKLWGIFDLWSTFDAPVDEGYYGKYWVTPTNYQSSKLTRYIYRLKWLSRNTGYGWAYLLFAIPRGTGFQWKGVSKTYFGYHNDFNIGWRDHAGMDKLDYAGRIIGLRRS